MAVINRLLQQRHAFYRGLLVVEVLALVGLRGLEESPRLVSLVYLVIASVAVLLDSPLLPQHRLERKVGESIPQQLKLRLQKALLRRQVVGFAWLLAFLIEVIWQTALVIDPALAVQLSVLHLVVWLVLMLQLLWGLVNALAEEPLFNSDLLMGAAAGYLLVGFTGGIVLNSLLVLDPAAFNLQDHGHALPVGVGHAPAMLGAAFASLTTLGSPSLTNGSLTSLTGSVCITIVGQLYVAILIAGVLGKPRKLGKSGQPAAAPESEHPEFRRAAAPIKLRRSRR